MSAALLRHGDDATVVGQYLDAMRAAARRTGRSTTQAAHTFHAKLNRAGGWDRLRPDQQVDAVGKARSFASWLMVTGGLRVDAELLSVLNLRLGNAARLFCPDDYRWFCGICQRLDIIDADVALQWNTLGK
ncbi:MAG: integrase, partial [Chloroflexi bacterium]|nr:integrase [Chloroflexota bacterium]